MPTVLCKSNLFCKKIQYTIKFGSRLAKKPSNRTLETKSVQIRLILNQEQHQGHIRINVSKSFQRRLQKYCNFVKIFTGSTIDNKTGLAFESTQFKGSFRLNDMCSVFTAELSAVLEAIKTHMNSHDSKYLICSDLLSSLHSIKDMFSKPYCSKNTRCYKKLRKMVGANVGPWSQGNSRK